MRLVLDPLTPGSQTLERATIKQPDGTWMASGIALAAGIWTVRVIVAPAGGKPIPLDAPMVIER
jgi:hypothetical protein